MIEPISAIMENNSGTKDFVLYLLMRKDMSSLNHVGKLIAQGAHAANYAAAAIGAGKFGPEIMAQFRHWEKSTEQGFGTTIVLGCIVDRYNLSQRPLKIEDIRTIIEQAVATGFAAGVVTDPSYPLKDGLASHAFPCETCGWIFGSRSKLSLTVASLDLHKQSVEFL